MVKDEESLLCAVLSYGVAVSLFDKVKKKGGLCYYLYPNAKTTISKTPLFALPSISTLVGLFLEKGSVAENLEAHIFGGAVGNSGEEKMKMIATENVKIAKKLLEKKGVTVRSEDCGGTMGRKLIFNTKTGESIVAKVNSLRKQDWSLEFVLEESKENSNSTELRLYE